jgi:inosine-uridine nucleoside N-ribohydrolase
MVGLLLSLSASPEELDILLISVTYGNVPLKKSVPSHSLFSYHMTDTWKVH